MLELRPNCELCDCDLPPDAANARICSYECTYCSTCADDVLRNVCPTCGGNFAPRPVRPRRAWRAGLNLGLGFHPPSRTRKRSGWSAHEIECLVEQLGDLDPSRR